MNAQTAERQSGGRRLCISGGRRPTQTVMAVANRPGGGKRVMFTAASDESKAANS